jgi:UV excision repair protein RAD23
MAQSMGVPADQLKMLGRALAAGGGAGGQAPPGSTIVRLTRDEAAAVDRLAELGVSRQAALEAYLACDKKEDLAANFLMQNMGFD